MTVNVLRLQKNIKRLLESTPNRTLKTATSVWLPVVYDCGLTSLQANVNCTLPGVSHEILDFILTALSIPYHLDGKSWEEWGGYDYDNETWTGTLGELYRGNYDMFAGEYEYTETRDEYFDYSYFLRQSEQVFIRSKPINSGYMINPLKLIFGAFSNAVIVAFFGTLLALGVGLALCKSLEYTMQHSHQSSFLAYLWHAPDHRSLKSGRTIFLLFSFFTALASGLLQPTLLTQLLITPNERPFSSIEELIRVLDSGKYKLVTENPTYSFFETMETSNLSYYVRLKMAVQKNGLRIVNSLEKVTTVLKTGNYLYPSSSHKAAIILQDDCNLEIVPLDELPRTWIAFMFAPNSTWIPVFNQASIMWQSYFHYTEEKYTKGALKCTNGIAKGKFGVQPLALKSFIGIRNTTTTTMATSKEAVVLLLDVGANMALPANNRGDTYLDLALEGIQWILNRKIFAESKDEAALVLFASDTTKNPLEDGDSYSNIEVVSELQVPTFDLIKYAQNEVKATENEGDFLSALVVASEVLRGGTDGKKFAQKTIVLLSNLGGSLVDADEKNYKQIANALQANGIELNVIGADQRKSGEDADDNDDDQAGASAANNDRNQGGGAKKTDNMLKGEMVISRLLEIVDGETYSLSEALEMLSYFSTRQVKPMPWKCDLELGEQVKVPLILYLKTKSAKLKQTWKRFDPSSNTEVQAEQMYERLKVAEDQPGPSTDDDNDRPFELPTADQFQVNKEDLVKGYKFGTTLVPFTEDDLAALKYKPDGKCLMILGFTKKEKVLRQYLVGDGTHYAIPNPSDEVGAVAFSALVQAMDEEGLAAIVRYAYNARSAPRLGVLFPKRSRGDSTKERPDMFVYTALPFSEDLRCFIFPEYPANTEPDDTDQMQAVDELINSMDLTTSHVDAATGRRVEDLRPEQVLNPHMQRVYQMLQHRALYPDQPLPDAESRIVRDQLEPRQELVNLAAGAIEKIKRRFLLTPVDDGKRKRRAAAEMFANAGATAEPAMKMSKQDDDAPANIGSVNPVRDFNSLVVRDFNQAVTQLISMIQQFVFDTLGNQALYQKTLDCLMALRDAALQYAKPDSYNEYLMRLKEDCVTNNRTDFWKQLLQHSAKVKPISKSESSSSDMTQDEADALMAQREIKEETKSSQLPENDNLLDELE
uniref:VWFA domain-containing protein n=1 Tax=Plectus sambesii TaxID=2011161 RepID=A0A914VAH2_9BILA